MGRRKKWLPGNPVEILSIQFHRAPTASRIFKCDGKHASHLITTRIPTRAQLPDYLREHETLIRQLMSERERESEPALFLDVKSLMQEKARDGTAATSERGMADYLTAKYNRRITKAKIHRVVQDIAKYERARKRILKKRPRAGSV